ncbi:hypothetical protein JKP88DRAFT_348625 [Tribonema minus]|uniref:Uncharacterized protein n=1 Tax=Tribonema minus TaxID=303371 RepID=A0A835Z5H1_9STRA|nr:hypothetical protein JKP88DRAFT_348625 [Tribonema minus]
MAAAMHEVRMSSSARAYLRQCLDAGLQQIPAVQGDAGLARLAEALEAAHACASFECITSFSGDHGYPERAGVDVLVCTAIHTLSAGASIPWTQGEVYRFTSEQGLVCAQTLLALDPDAAETVFEQYNLLRHQFGPHSQQVEHFFAACAAPESPQRMVALCCLPHHLVSAVVEGFVVRSVTLAASDAANLLELYDATQVDSQVESGGESRRLLLSDDVRRGVKDKLQGERTGHAGSSQPRVEQAVQDLLRERGYSPCVLRPKLSGSCQLVDRKKAAAAAAEDAIAENPLIGGGGDRVAALISEGGGGGSDAGTGDERGEGGRGGGGAAQLLAQLLANHADDGATRFVVGVLKTCIQLRVKSKLAHYTMKVATQQRPAQESDKKMKYWQRRRMQEKQRRQLQQQQQQQNEEDTVQAAAAALGAGEETVDLLILHTFQDVDQYRFHRAEVFMNFYPKFDNAKQLEADKIIQGLWPKGGGSVITGGIKKFKFSYYMYLTMMCRAVIGSVCRPKAGKKELEKKEWLTSCTSRLSTWGMSQLQQVPYMRRLSGWWEYLTAAAARNDHLDAFDFLDAFQQFLREEHHWCDVVAGAGAGGITAGLGGLSLSSSIARPVFLIAGGRATRAYATQLATLLNAPLLTDHKKQKPIPEALSEDRFWGAVVVPNPDALDPPNLNPPNPNPPEGEGGHHQQQPVHIAIAKATAFPPCAVVIADVTHAARDGGKFPAHQWLERARAAGCAVVDLSAGAAASELSTAAAAAELSTAAAAAELSSAEDSSAEGVAARLLREEREARVLPQLLLPLGCLGT